MSSHVYYRLNKFGFSFKRLRSPNKHFKFVNIHTLNGFYSVIADNPMNGSTVYGGFQRGVLSAGVVIMTNNVVMTASIKR